METSSTTLSPTTVGFGLAASVAILCNTLLVFAKEKNPELLAAMKNLLGHHWITHGVAIVLLFLVLGILFSQASDSSRMNGKTLSVVLFLSTFVAGVALVAWFLFE